METPLKSEGRVHEPAVESPTARTLRAAPCRDAGKALQAVRVAPPPAVRLKEEDPKRRASL